MQEAESSMNEQLDCLGLGAGVWQQSRLWSSRVAKSKTIADPVDDWNGTESCDVID